MAQDTEKFIKETIRCSAGKGVMPVNDCLQCALNGDNICGFSYPLLLSLYEDNVRTGVHVSDINNCARMAFYNATEESIEMPHERLALTLGTAVHHHLERADEMHRTEMAVEADGVVGTLDAWFPETGTIMDFKTTRWLTPSKLPYGHHAEQIQIYGYMMKKMGYDVRELKLQYIDVSGPTKCKKCYLPLIMTTQGTVQCGKCGATPANAHLGAMVIDIPLGDDEQIAALLAERSALINESVESGTPPPKEVGFLCNYCNHREMCKPYESEGDTEW